MLRHRVRADDGFTLVELLVVILIAGILAAIALPSLLSQRAKAHDTHAKTVTTTAAKAATAFGTERGSFDELAGAELVKIEPSLQRARNLQVEGAGQTFTVTVESVAGTAFTITRTADGDLTRDCAPAGSGGCRETADARGHRW